MRNDKYHRTDELFPSDELHSQESYTLDSLHVYDNVRTLSASLTYNLQSHNSYDSEKWQAKKKDKRKMTSHETDRIQVIKVSRDISRYTEPNNSITAAMQS